MIYKNFDLKSHNTFQTPATAKFCIVHNDDNFSKDELDLIKSNQSLFLGSGSNLFFVGDFDGVIIKNEILGKVIKSNTSTQVIVSVGAGENWDEFVAWSLDNNLYGLENLSLIPGTVGAAPVQNIGAYGREVSDFIVKVETIDLMTGLKKTFSRVDCEFAYRDSIFKHSGNGSYIITKVDFELSKTPEVVIEYKTLQEKLIESNIADPSPQQVREAVISVRQSRLPDWKTIPNAGSFFKNPIISIDQYEKGLKEHPNMPSYDAPLASKKIPAAWLLDQAGWKGRWFGNVGCYKNQPLILITNGHASGMEILEFARDIIVDIQNKFNIALEPEVTIIGHDI